jgi:DNA polymerase-3 subunit epsilon
MLFHQRPFAITNISTTGLDAQRHEIIEIGLLVVDQKNLDIIDEFETKIYPNKIQSSNKKALRISGYDPDIWANSTDLTSAMQKYAKKTKGAIFFAHNLYFDWSFISEAFQQTEVEDEMDYHRADLFSMALAHSHKLPGLKKYNLASLCEYFGIEPEPEPHRAINGVYCEYEILKKLREL